jgi:signal transduction histidine kinase/DNA-binding response OmpR family regulator
MSVGIAMRANILVVDDRPDKLLVVQAILEELGQNLYTASSGEEALRHVLARDFALILLDVNMPGLDGLETAALIRSRKRSAHIPIIFITADYADELRTARGYSLGAVDYITSPIVPEVLRAKVRVFVDLFLLAEQARHQAQERIALVEEKAAREAAEQATRRLAFLAEATSTLAASLDVTAATRELAKLVVPSIADVSLLCLREEARARSCEIAWSDPSAPDAVASRTLDAPLPSWLGDAIDGCIASGKPALVPAPAAHGPLAADHQPLVIAEAFCMPLTARGRTLGALALGLHGAHRRFDSDTLSIAADLAGRAAISLDNALLYRKIHDEDRRKNEFLAMLAHELRNPLAPISNAVHLLTVQEHDPVRLKWAREIIGRQLRQLVRLVDDLLDVSRITRGKIDLKLETIDAGAVIAAAVETSRPNVDQLEHTLTVLLPPDPIRLRGDFARVSQVLANLVNNAAKYTPRGGRISVSAERAGDEVVFRVRDSGVGIPAEFLSSIFEPFTQVGHTLDRAQGGLGIGLTLVRSLVQMQGGTVTAASGGRDQGSEFVVRLAALRDATPATAMPEAAPRIDATADGLCVLVVDDNRDVADTTATILRLSGCDTHVAYDGSAGLDAAARLRPHAVLLDIGLPGLDGYQVAERLRADPQHRRTLVVAVSGYGQEEDRIRSKAAGFDYHVVKPIDPAVITGLLASLRDNRTPPLLPENVVHFPARRVAD